MTPIVLVGYPTSPYASHTLRTGGTVLDLTLTNAWSAPGTPSVHLIHDKSLPKRPESVLVEDPFHLIKILLKLCPRNGALAVWDAHAPFTDPKLSSEMAQLQKETACDYVVGDLFPQGLAPIIINYSVLEELFEEKGHEGIVSVDDLKASLEKVYNRYDVELVPAPRDLRHHRLSFSCTTKRAYDTVRGLIEGGTSSLSFQELLEKIDRSPEIFRPCPAYVEIEITNQCEHSCCYCPRSIMTRPIEAMSPSLFSKIISELIQWAGEPSILIGGLGEPAEHPHLVEMIGEVLAQSNSPLYLETSSTNLPNALLDYVDESKNFHILRPVDGVTGAVQKAMRPSLPLNEAEKAIDKSIRRHPKNVHLQWLRCKDNESEVYSFHDRWDAYQDQLVLIGYNPYQNRLPSRSSVNLAPLNRFPCVHLSRDLNILSNGDVVFCKQDINAEYLIGSTKKESLETLWAKMHAPYKEDQKGNLHPFCKNCDQWYQFND